MSLMHNEKITTETITVPEVEQLLAETRTELIETAKRDGKFAGLKNIPAPPDASCSAHLATLKTYAEQKRSAALSLLQPDIHIAAIERIDAKYKEQGTQTASQIEEREHLNSIDKRELEGKRSPAPKKSNLFGWALTVVLCLSDLAFNSAAFEFLGDSLIYAVGIALGVAAATFVLSKGVIHTLSVAVHKDKRWYAPSALIALAALCGFWVLSGFRSSVMAANGAVGTSQGGFFLLNLFFFIASTVTGMLFFPADSESHEEREYARRIALIEKRDAEIKELKHALEALGREADADRRKHLQLLSYTVHTVNRFRAIHFEAVAMWKSTNLLSRPDRAMPASFSQVVPDLDLLEFNLPPTLNLFVA